MRDRRRVRAPDSWGLLFNPVRFLAYHLKLRSFVVVELKSVPFEPAFVGQVDFYLSVVNDL